jgi:hypothetical protein
MQRNRFWIEIIALVTMIACALALLIATLGAGAAAVSGQDTSSASPQTQQNPSPSVQTPPAQAPDPASPQKQDSPSLTYEGMVTCSRCGAKHAAKLDRPASGCVLACVHAGAAFALVDGEKVYQLDGDLNLLKRFAGQRAQVTGVAHGNTIEVSAVASS